jgi:hypothetical protein
VNVKLAYLLILGVALVIGWLIGRAVAKFTVSRIPGRTLYAAGSLLFLCGVVGSMADRRFYFLSIGGLALQTAGLVGSFRRRRTLKDHAIDLWAPPKYRAQLDR